MKILFLHTELAGYFIACITHLAKHHDVEIHVVCRPAVKEAPFTFELPQGISFYKRKELDHEQLVELAERINPDILYCGGWNDKSYLSLSKHYFNKIPTLMGFDNRWVNSIRQNIASIVMPGRLKNRFSHIWIAGLPQREYVGKLGFDNEQIIEGIYSADYDKFNALYDQFNEQKSRSFPHTFFYVGRYVSHKGIKDLLDAFKEIKQAPGNDWELWCMGAGELEHEITATAGVRNIGFVQPDKIDEFVGQGGVFVLPSHYEPWGVALHEFAAAGFPIICSKAVGASSMFVGEDQNGYLFEAGNKANLKKSMERMIQLSDSELNDMGMESNKLAERLTPETWSQSLLSVLVNKHEL
ncbi:MAG: glycosyltransferase [Bacteroidetes bacterium]|nr:glycosyltransferase [Bacteroidota bacterium]